MSSQRNDDQASILLVDDRSDSLFYLQEVLREPGYELTLARSDREALELLGKREFAVVLLDVAMPGMDGFEVAARMQADERSGGTPIIFITAGDERPDWALRAYAVGAVDFLVKPLDRDAVRGKVAVFVRLARQRREIARQAELLQDNERRSRELEVAELRSEHERSFRQLTESLPIVIWTASPAGEAVYFNQRWYEDTGLDESDSLGDVWLQAVHPDDRIRLARDWSAAVAGGSALLSECRLRRADGSFCWYLCRAVPERGSSGAVTRWLGSFTDVNQQRQAQEQAETALRVRDEFLAIASHELKTPLTALSLQIDQLERDLGRKRATNLPDRVAGLAEQVSRFAILIDNLLDVSRVTHGKMQVLREPFDLTETTREVVGRLRREARHAGCELRFQANSSTIGMWDRLRLDQVLMNLLTNAIKYGAGHPIDVAIEGDDTAVRLSVRDRGIGIDPADMTRIFDRFERAVSPRHYGGLGLGLYISNQIVEAHGGRFEVTSEPGLGSTFTVVLPVNLVVAGAQVADPPKHERRTASS